MANFRLLFLIKPSSSQWDLLGLTSFNLKPGNPMYIFIYLYVYINWYTVRVYLYTYSSSQLILLFFHGSENKKIQKETWKCGQTMLRGDLLATYVLIIYSLKGVFGMVPITLVSGHHYEVQGLILCPAQLCSFWATLPEGSTRNLTLTVQLGIAPG